jgi:hypothetical protein
VPVVAAPLPLAVRTRPWHHYALPMDRTKWLIAAVVILLAPFARAESLQLRAPARGATLRGGSFAELSWSATELPAGAEEWEGFLSVDGGKYYAFRITPHLRIGLRRFTFLVPNVDTHDARILIRAGNEVHEAHLEDAGRFSIARDAHAEHLFARPLQFGRGEAARDGDPDVVSWTDGARSGGGVTQQSSVPVPVSSIDSVATLAHELPPVLAPATASIVAPSSATAAPVVRTRRPRAREPRPTSVDLLLVCSRWNV